MELAKPIPLPADPGLLWHANLMRTQISQLFLPALPPRTKLRLYHEHMADLVEHGHLIAVDCTLDIAYLTLDDPAIHPRLVTMTPEELRARINDLLAIHGRILN